MSSPALRRPSNEATYRVITWFDVSTGLLFLFRSLRLVSYGAFLLSSDYLTRFILGCLALLDVAMTLQFPRKR